MLELKVMEMYEACQGEGSRIGEVTTFVRMFGCNFRCVWCDTAYSINMKEWKQSRQKEPAYRLLSPLEINSAIATHSVVITGGEPCIHKNLVPLLRYLTLAGHHVTVETNASMLPKGLEEWFDEGDSFLQTADVLWSLSPKLGSSQPAHKPARGRWQTTWVNARVLQWYLDHTDCQCQLKFVISDPIDLLDFESLVKGLHFGASHRHRTPIILQPNGNVIRHALREEGYLAILRDLQSKARQLSKEMDLSIRALPQLHVLLHGQRRYV